MKPVIVYITCKDEVEALRIAKVIVSEKLAACANVIPAMKSVYFWKEEMQIDQEAILILKSHEALYQDLEAKVKEIHSYETPAILCLPLIAGNRDYLEWMAGEMIGIWVG